MGGILSKGEVKGDTVIKPKERFNQAQHQNNRADDDTQLPPLVILKDCGIQTIQSYPYSSKNHSRSLLLNRISIFILLTAVVPYIVLCLLVAHSDVVQSILTYAHYPTFLKHDKELQDLIHRGLISARNVNLTKPDGITLRGWHIMPMEGQGKSYIAKMANLSLSDTSHIDSFYDSELASGSRPIVIYLHGNTNNRALWYRIGQVKTLSSILDAHIIAFDYAGFGDSEGWPSEATTASDALAIFDWVHAIAARNCGSQAEQEGQPSRSPKVLLYGHSLGSAIAVQLAVDLFNRAPNSGQRDGLLSGIILDAPFATFTDAIMGHPSSAFLRIFPFVQTYILNHLQNRYDTISKIGPLVQKEAELPIVIFHGLKDDKISVAQSRRLYDTAVSSEAVQSASGGKRGKKSKRAGIELIELEHGDHVNNFQQPLFVIKMLESFSSLKD